MILRLSLIALLLAMPALAQNRPMTTLSAPKAARLAVDDGSILPGKWTYRSFINTVDPVSGDPQKALNLIFGEGIFTFAVAGTSLTGTFDMGGGYVLDLDGKVRAAEGDAPLTVEIAGRGRTNTPTAGWEYDYRGYLAYHWPNGVDQGAALVGSVIRAVAHDGGAAGFVASFIAVKQP
jgi:hypothetical protein